MNGLVEDDLVSALRKRRREIFGLDGLGCKAIYGGMALICTNRLSPGIISHTYGGKLVCGVAYSADAEKRGGRDGDHYGWVDSDRRAIADLFRRSSPVPFVFDPNLRRGR
jgi:ketopantoate reductase